MKRIVIAAIAWLAVCANVNAQGCLSSGGLGGSSRPGTPGPAGSNAAAGFPSSGTAVGTGLTGKGTATNPLAVIPTAFFPSSGATVGSGITGDGTATNPLTASGGGGGFPSSGAAVSPPITGDGTGTTPLGIDPAAFFPSSGVSQYNGGITGDGTATTPIWKKGYGDNNVNNSTHGDTYPCYIGGGYGNDCQHEGSVILAGRSNTVTENYAVVVGGFNNTAYYFSVVGGGDSNQATGLYSTSLGGILNIASGDHSMALGTKARAIHTGAFVWNGDETQFTMESTAANQTTFYNSGGFRIMANTNGVDVSTFSANGDVHFPKLVYAGLNIVQQNCGAGQTSCIATCTGTGNVTGGGCNGTTSAAEGYPSSATTYTCTSLVATTLSAYVVCANLR